MEFKDWLNGKFLEWERSQPRRQSYNAFSKYLGIKQSALSQWLNGNFTPSYNNVKIMSEKLGDEVYLAAGFAIPGEADDFAKFPSELQHAFLDAKEILQEMGTPTEAESLAVINAALNKAGYRLISNTDDEPAK